MKRSPRIVAVFFLTVVLGAGCAEEQRSTNPPLPDLLTLSFAGLEDLGSGYAYEGWLVVEGIPVSTGTFTVDDSGNTSQSEFRIDPADLSAATEFILTIEPDPDNAPGPFTLKPLISLEMEDFEVGMPQWLDNGAGSFPTGRASR